MIDDGIDNYETSDKISAADRVALRYADRMASAPDKIDAEIYEQLGEHYSAAEIIELGAYIGFNIGYHTFFGSLDFYPMFTPDGRLVTQEESRRIYGAQPTSHLKGPMQRATSSDEAAE